MIMRLFANAELLAVIAVATGVVAAGCSSSPGVAGTSANGERAANTVQLALQPVSGVTLSSIHYVVGKAGSLVPVLEGDLPTPGTATAFTVGLPIPTGVGYSLSLSGVSTESDAVTCTGGVSSFDVRPGQATNLSMPLSCTDAATGPGNNQVTIQTDTCPRLMLDFIVAAPNSANVPNGTIQVSSKAHELDAKPITYAWTVAGGIGVFGAASAASTTFTCKARGSNADLTATASNGECTKSISTPVSCNDSVSARCGDGVLSPGEVCDGTLFAAPTCGVQCTADCKLLALPDLCGDGCKSPQEVCDPGYTSNNCGADCGPITSAACLACENDPFTCQDFVNCDIAVGNAAAGSPAAGTPKSNLCNEVLDCVRDSGCAANGFAPIHCYCGSASAADCQAGLGNGVCKPQLERGLETTAFTSISSRFKNSAYGGGVAMARIDCDQGACSSQCGL